MTPVIEADGLTKFYGSTRGIEDLSFTVGAGEVLTWGNVGFLASLYDASLPAAERAALRRALDNAWERFTR